MFQWLFRRNASHDDSDIDLSPIDALPSPAVEYDICGRPWRVQASAPAPVPASPDPSRQRPALDENPFKKYLALRDVHEPCAPDWAASNPELAQMAETSTIQAYKDFVDQERVLGRKFSEEERRKWLFDRAAFLVTNQVAAFEKDKRGEHRDEGGELVAELRKLRATVESQAKPHGPLDTANAFWNDHPFLSGMAGAYAFHKFKRSR